MDILKPEEKISWKEYKETIQDKNVPHLLIDVRPTDQTKIIKLEHSISIPLETIVDGEGLEKMKKLIKPDGKDGIDKVFLMCRKGNASQKALRYVKENMEGIDGVEMKSINGGITAWVKEINPELPVYLELC